MSGHWLETREQGLLNKAVECARRGNLVESIHGLQDVFMQSMDPAVIKTVEALMHIKALEASDELVSLQYAPQPDGDGGGHE